MNSPLTREEAMALLPELALGMLPRDEAERLMAFIRAFPEAQQELASLRAAASALDSSVPADPMVPARKLAMRDRLMSRAAASSTADATGTVRAIASTAAVVAAASPTPAAPTLRLEPSEPRKPISRADVIADRPNPISRFVPWFAAAASIGLAFAQVRTNRTVVAERDAVQTALKAATVATSQLSAQLASRDSLVDAMTGAQVRVVELASTAKLPPGARMFWDRLTNRWTLVTHDLNPAQAGRTYQLWLVTAKSEKISAGTFNTNAKGYAVVQATYALAEADLAAIAITEEPMGGSPQPTGTILVAGAPTR